MWAVIRSNELNPQNLQVQLGISENMLTQPSLTKILLKGRKCFKVSRIWIQIRKKK